MYEFYKCINYKNTPLNKYNVLRKNYSELVMRNCFHNVVEKY